MTDTWGALTAHPVLCFCILALVCLGLACWIALEEEEERREEDHE